MRLQQIGSFEAPLYVTAPPGDRGACSSSSRAGRSASCAAASKLDKPFLDVSNVITSGGERGLLSLAFAPDYAQSGLFYVYYTDPEGDARVVEYRRRNADEADPNSARQVIRFPDFEPNHNGGLALFGPDDLLYIGTGDGGGGGDPHGPIGHGQSLGTLLGKILRIDPRRSGSRPYSVPRDNPFVGRSGARGRDLQLRAAQPVALLVRPPDRRPDDRRRRPGRLGGGQLRAPRQGERARTSAGACSRAASATRRASGRRAR